MEVVRFKAEVISHENFQPFGQLANPCVDGVEYGSQDVHLNLSNGIPRFYIMQLKRTGLRFKSITHHAKVTQCLGSVRAQPWYMAVASPTMLPSQAEGAQQSKAGHFYIPPSPSDVKVFKVDGPRFIKLHQGTWHAGPLFEDDSMDFYNLELTDTNVVDHTTHVFPDYMIIEDEAKP